MNFPILIAPVTGSSTFSASLGAPFNISVEAPTSAEAEQKIIDAVRKQLDAGVEVRWIFVPNHRTPREGQVAPPHDELTQEWLENVRQFRMECDEADRRRVDQEETRRTRSDS